LTFALLCSFLLQGERGSSVSDRLPYHRCSSVGERWPDRNLRVSPSSLSSDFGTDFLSLRSLLCWLENSRRDNAEAETAADKNLPDQAFSDLTDNENKGEVVFRSSSFAFQSADLLLAGSLPLHVLVIINRSVSVEGCRAYCNLLRTLKSLLRPTPARPSRFPTLPRVQLPTAACKTFAWHL